MVVLRESNRHVDIDQERTQPEFDNLTKRSFVFFNIHFGSIGHFLLSRYCSKESSQRPLKRIGGLLDIGRCVCLSVRLQLVRVCPHDPSSVFVKVRGFSSSPTKKETNTKTRKRQCSRGPRHDKHRLIQQAGHPTLSLLKQFKGLFDHQIIHVPNIWNRSSTTQH